MHRKRIVVLKFGSSVLQSEADLPAVAGEIDRWIREDFRVVAVVSAMGTTTNRLFDQARRYGADQNHEAVAALVATGESTSAALLSLALHSVGVRSSVLDAACLSLRTHGPTLDAEPCALDANTLLQSLGKYPVAVVPGFVGRQEDGTTSLLGRGGSDLTAFFIAHHLGSRCRLVKDVDGLYDSDPALNASAARYATISWDEACEVGGKIVQAKAVQFAKAHKLTFEVGSLGSVDPTLVGEEAEFFATVGGTA